MKASKSEFNFSYDNAHNCTFDYKTTGREELRKSNPQASKQYNESFKLFIQQF